MYRDDLCITYELRRGFELVLTAAGLNKSRQPRATYTTSMGYRYTTGIAGVHVLVYLCAIHVFTHRSISALRYGMFPKFLALQNQV